MSGDRSTAMTMPLLRVGSRGLVALALLFLSNYPARWLQFSSQELSTAATTPGRLSPAA